MIRQQHPEDLIWRASTIIAVVWLPLFRERAWLEEGGRGIGDEARYKMYFFEEPALRDGGEDRPNSAIHLHDYQCAVLCTKCLACSPACTTASCTGFVAVYTTHSCIITISRLSVAMVREKVNDIKQQRTMQHVT